MGPLRRNSHANATERRPRPTESGGHAEEQHIVLHLHQRHRQGGAGTEQYTLFAPTDEAFSALPAGTLDRLLQPANKDELASLVNYHLVSGRKTTADVGKWQSARTVQGQAAPIKVAEGTLSVGGAHVTRPDIMARNGVIHGIDKVNIPEAKPH